MAVIVSSYQRVSEIDGVERLQERYFVRCECGGLFTCPRSDFDPKMLCLTCTHQLMNRRLTTPPTDPVPPAQTSG